MSRIILRDGKVAELRPATQSAEDVEMVHALFRNASADSLYFRFFHTVREVQRSVIRQMLEGTGPNGLSLLCLAGDKALGIGTYVPGETDTQLAEVSFFIDDEYQGKGLGSLLLEHMAEHAWLHGFQRFEAHVLRENRKMLQVFNASGYETSHQGYGDTIHLFLPLSRTERSRALAQTREKLATAASLAPFFRPRTVAVIGASRDPNRLGHQLFRHILAGEFQGTVYPVNPNTASVASVRAYATLADVPDEIDLAVIVVPAPQVPAIVEECIAADVRAVMITSTGFSEAGPTGVRAQQEIVERLRSHGCRLIGPNSMGLVTTVPGVRLNASFAAAMPRSSGIAIASQSGALGIAILEYAEKIGIGVSHFVSMGNRADISANDLLQYWEDDPDTQMVVLYLESFGNPRKFTQIAKRLTRSKPLLVVKGARTAVSYSISESRRIWKSAAEPVVDALFQQTGVIRLDTLQELFDVAALISQSPLPAGRRVAIVTNTAGGAVVAVDALQKEGLTFVGPVLDLGSDALPEGYRDVLPQLLRDPAVDAVVVLFIPVGTSEEPSVTASIRAAIEEAYAASDAGQKTIVANFLARGDYTIRYIEANGQRVPIYPFPEQGIRALAKLVTYAEYLTTAQGRIPDLGNVDVEHARALVRSNSNNRTNVDEWMAERESLAVLQAVGICIQGSIADDSTALLPFQRRKLNLQIRVHVDALFGPVMTVTQCISIPEAKEPVVLSSVQRVIPLTAVDAHDMCEAVVTPAGDDDMHSGLMSSLSDVLLRVSHLVDEVPEIEEVHITSIDFTDRAIEVTGGAVKTHH